MSLQILVYMHSIFQTYIHVCTYIHVYEHVTLYTYFKGDSDLGTSMHIHTYLSLHTYASYIGTWLKEAYIQHKCIHKARNVHAQMQCITLSMHILLFPCTYIQAMHIYKHIPYTHVRTNTNKNTDTNTHIDTLFKVYVDNSCYLCVLTKKNK